MSGPRIALDAFGADRRPSVEIRAAVLAAEQGLDIDLVGDEALLRPGLVAAIAERLQEQSELEDLESLVEQRVCLIHAPDQIAMDESPAKAVRSKLDASLVVAVDRVAAGTSAAVVSAGNSGALLAAGLFRLGRIAGVDRPAILTSFPRVGGDVSPDIGKLDRTYLLDAGANIECKPLNLVQFAVMGATVARLERGIARPRVAVLANGSEAGKGTALTRSTHELLSAEPSATAFEYVGPIEPAGLFTDVCDVAVTDGWTGNMLLKLGEGAMAAWPAMLRESLRGQGLSPAIAAALSAVKARVDPEIRGGAPLVGVDGTLIICHGASGPRALLAGLAAARHSCRLDTTTILRRAMVEHSELFERARGTR